MSRAESQNWLSKKRRNTRGARSRTVMLTRPFEGARLERLEERIVMTLTPIAQPTAAYVAANALMPITVSDGTVMTSVSNAGETVNFSPSLTAATVPTTWSTWNSPPSTESNTPRVASSGGGLTETLTLATPASTFGFEAEPSAFGAYAITATYFSGATQIGQLSQSVNGNAGALLFAGTTTSPNTQPITSVVVTAPAGSGGFALANFRADDTTTVSTTKTAQVQIDQNQNLTYNLSITNTGLLPATFAQLTDPLPAGTVYEGETDPGAPRTISTPPVGSNGTVTFTDTGSLAPGATANFTITIQATVSNPIGSVVSNTVTSGAANASQVSATANTTVVSPFYELFSGQYGDALKVEVDPNTSNGVFDDFYVDGTLVGSQLLNTLNGIGMYGEFGGETFTADFTNGNPIPATSKGSALYVEGESNPGTQTLILQNGTETADSYTPGPNPGQGGQLLTSGGVTSQISFNGLAPVVDSLAGPATVSADGNNNVITYSQGVIAPTDGLVTVDNFESYEFTNKTTVTLDGGGGNDTFNINNPTIPTGLTGITVNGGPGVSKLNVDAYGNAPTVTTPGSITIPTLTPVTYTGIAAVQITDAPDLPLTPVATVVTGTAGAPLTNFEAGVFHDGTPSGVASDFAVTIDWGDGSVLGGGTIVPGGTFNAFGVLGSHTYAVAGTYTLTAFVTDLGSNGTEIVGGIPISIQDGGGSTTPITSTVTIAQSALLPIGQPVLGVEGTPIPTGTQLATFTDSGGPGPVAGYTATSTIGGTTVPVAVSLEAGSANTFQVLTTAPYTPVEEGILPVVVSITNTTGTPTETATTSTTATIADAPLTAGAPTVLTANTGVAIPATTVIGTFTDGNAGATTADYTDVIYWGDGSASTTGTLVATGGGGFEVEGGHTYANPGTYAITIDVFDDGGMKTVLTGTETVTDLPVTGSTKNFTTVEGQNTGLFVLATFSDPNTLATVADVQATLSIGGWGDGTPTTAGIPLVVQQIGVNPANGQPTFEVLGSHTYAEETAAGTPDALSVIITTAGGATTTLTSAPGSGVTVLDAALTGSAGNSITGVEGNSTGTVLLGTFVDANQGATVADYTAGGGSVVVNWGDGSAPQTLAAANLSTIGTANGVTWTISAAHTYAEEGVYSYSITVTDDGGSATKVFGTATVADAALTTPVGVAVTGTEGKAIVNAPVLMFTDSNPLAPISDFTATINWGDGVQGLGTVTQPGGVGTAFVVTGSHTYTDEGSYTIQVEVVDDGGSTIAGTTTATIADAPLTAAAGIAVSGVEGQALNNVPVATFTDTNPDGSVKDFSATITWGDATATTSGIIQLVGGSAAGPVYEVLGSHDYQEEGTYPISVVINDVGGQSAAINADTGNGASATILDAPISGQGAFVQGQEGLGLSQTGDTTFGPVVIGTFTDTNPFATVADYTVAPGAITVNWGDGSAVETLSASNVTATPSATTVLFTITDGHVYAEEGTYQILISVNDDGGASTIIHAEATIADAPLTAVTPQPVVSTTESPIYPVPEFGTPIFTGPVGSFTDANPTAPLSDFKVTIDWGDGTPNSAGTVSQPGVLGTPFIVTGSHTYADAGVNGGIGTYPLTIYVSDVGGSKLTITNTANVADIPIQLSGILNPKSDTGESDSDDITDDNTPNFYGTSEPRSTVTLWATPLGGGAATQIGQTTTLANGTWNITSAKLADGNYKITVTAVDQFGKTTAGPVTLVSDLLIDTVGPRVIGEVFDRLGGSVYLLFQDTSSGLNLTSILDAANYSLTKQKGSLPGRYVVTAANLIFNGGPTGGDIVQLQINGGAPIKGGYYLFTAISKSVLDPSGIQDVAGNALDGEFYSPNTMSGNGVPGGNFVADLDAYHDRIFPPATVIGSAQPNPQPTTGFNTVDLVYVNGILYGLPTPVVVPLSLRGTAEQPKIAKASTKVVKTPVVTTPAVKTVAKTTKSSTPLKVEY